MTNKNNEDNNIIHVPIAHSEEERTLQIRLDKWLWAARFYKTRPLARMAIIQGKVFYNGNKVSPSIVIKVGAKITLKNGDKEKIICISELSGRRKSLEEAKELYEEELV